MLNPNHKKWILLSLAIAVSLIFSGFSPHPSPLPQTGTVRFAVIGDYGHASNQERDVANLVKSWNPDFIVTAGDNNYPSGEASTIDENIGQYYHSYIYPYKGSYGAGASSNNFYPVLGNHDWYSSSAQPYFNYFTLPGNERYYDFVRGPVQFFMLDSDFNEPDGNDSSSTQAQWLKNRLSTSTAIWKIVVLHHAPYSSAEHGSNSTLQWPYQAWGATAVIAGHDHSYERILKNGFPYFVNGIGGNSIYQFKTPVSGSVIRYNDDYGAMLVDASDSVITFKFYSRTNTLVDTYQITTSRTGATFSDVTTSFWAWPYIEAIYASGITEGCSTSPLAFCPNDSVTRAQMAVFLEKGIHTSSYIPPNVAPTFSDTSGHWAEDWIEALKNDGITSGCGSGIFCPNSTVTRAQMAIFLLKAEHRASYTPPVSAITFNDISGHWARYWIEQLAKEGITSGCSSINYCPESPITRAQMAVLLQKTFGFPLP